MDLSGEYEVVLGSSGDGERELRAVITVAPDHGWHVEFLVAWGAFCQRFTALSSAIRKYEKLEAT